MSAAPAYADAGVELPAADEIHLWTWKLDPSGSTLAGLRAFLADGERERAARFHQVRHAHRYIAARGGLRVLLSRYLSCRPAAIALAEGAFGKPYLRRVPGRPRLMFNLSHSDDLACVAVSSAFELGLDIEPVKELPDDVAAWLLRPHEQDALSRLPPRARAQALMQCWTRKEAFVKALGVGLSLPVESFSVAFMPGEPARLVDFPSAPSEPAAWTIAHIAPAPGYVGAIAARRPAWRLADRGVLDLGA